MLHLWQLLGAMLTLSSALALSSDVVHNSTDLCWDRAKCPTGRRNRIDPIMNWDKVNCLCDDQCSDFGDCCPSANAHDPVTMKTAVNNYECVTIFYTTSYYMKGWCATDWSNPFVADLCQQAQDQEVLSTMPDPFLSTPATSAASGVTYRNYYCALCNHEQQQQIQSWEARVSCPTFESEDSQLIKDNLQYVNGSWGIWDVNRFRNCEVYPSPAQTIQHKLRECKNYISACANNWTDAVTAERCGAYTTLVYGPLVLSDSTIGEGYFGPSMYRNRHCAQCNGIEVDELACYHRDFRQAQLPPLSFSVLFDFGTKLSICSDGFLWDSFFKKCRLVQCHRDNYAYQSGRCVKIYESNHTTPLDNSTDCQRILFTADEYTEGINGSVIVVPYRRSYDPSEYEVVDDGILVCTEANFSSLMGWLTVVGIGLSCVCLVLHLMAFCLVPDLRNLSGKNLASLCVALLIGYACFLALAYQRDANNCHAMGYIMYYAFMASFAWMNVMAYDVWNTLRLATSQLRLTTGKQWRKFICYSLYAWLLPAVLCAVVFSVDTYGPGVVPLAFRPEMGQRHCWFGQPNAILIYFGAPLGVIMLANMFFFRNSIQFVELTAQSTTTISNHRLPDQRALYAKLALLMGLSWSLGLLAGYLQQEHVWYLFIVFNAFQGAFMLCAFTCTDKVYKKLDSLTSHRFTSNRKRRTDGRDVLDYRYSGSSQNNTTTSRLSTFGSPVGKF